MQIYDEIVFIFSTGDLKTAASLPKSQGDELGCLAKAVCETETFGPL